MEENSKGKRITFGVVLGILTGIAVVALTYIVDQLLSLIFPPFSLFDFMGRILPGALITLMIDMMVGIIGGLNLGSTAETAKLAEQSIALVQFVPLGGVFGGILSVLNSRQGYRRLPAYGFGLGLLLAVVFIGIEAFLNFPTLGLFGSLVWLVIVFGGWGLALGWLLRGIFHAPTEAPESRLSRREALYLGGTALIAVVASAVGLGFLVSSQEPKQESVVGPTPMRSESVSQTPPPTEEKIVERIEPAPGTRSEITPTDDFYRIDINTRPPEVDSADWSLEISGLVDQPETLTLEDIRARPRVSQYITLSCISNRIGGDLISTALWTGTRLKDLFAEVGLRSNANSIYIEAVDGFFETVMMEDIMDDRTLLVYEMNGQPLPAEHGFPLRIYIPNRYGMKQPKWIVRMKAVADEPPGFWVKRGWDESAIMRTTSVIDNVTIESTSDGRTLMGGIAHAGDRGISEVEVQVDDGPWQQASLRVPPLSQLTWVQWRFETTVPAGEHTAQVRAYDGNGELQVLEDNPPHPQGATGIDSFNFMV